MTEQLESLKEEKVYYQEKEKEIEVQKEKIKQLRQEEDERKKKFVLVKNKYEQELRETQEKVNELMEKIQSVSFE